MPMTRWGVSMPLANELPALPRGVVLHWTGGGPRANSVDLGAYHYVVELDGKVKAGKWSVASNMRLCSGGTYAMHTGGFNSYRVGISSAGMLNYVSPTRMGQHPLTEVQVRRMMEVAAHFIKLARLDPLNPAHLCTHQEVWTIHGVRGTQNHHKKDIEVLPFRPDLKPEEVGDYLRSLAAEALRVGAPEPEAPVWRDPESYLLGEPVDPRPPTPPDAGG
jgi:hypothetical protein